MNITSTLKLKQSPPMFPSIPNLLTHYKDHMSIKKIKETYTLPRNFTQSTVIRRSKESHKIFEQETINHQFLYSSESFD